MMQSDSQPIRATIVQPALTKYRVPVFRELARRPGIDLRVVYGEAPGLPNVVAEGFEAVPSRRWEGKVAGSLAMFHGAEWVYSARRRSDVIVLRWSPRSFTLLPAMLRARANRVGLVLWGHGYSKQEMGRKYGARRRVAKWASALLFYDPLTRADFVNAGWNPEKCFVAINSIDHLEIDESRRWWLERPQELESFRHQQRLVEGPVILFVSRLLPANRIDMLVRATGMLTREFAGLKTVIIGNGAAEKQRLESLAHEVGAANSVIFQEGIYNERQLAPWFLASDVFCYPANIGLSLLHAQWYGLPVVTSNNLGVQNPEVVALEHGVNGLTYEHGSIESLAASLRELLANKALRQSMSQAARRGVEERFTIPRMVDGLEAAIRYARASVHNPG